MKLARMSSRVNMLRKRASSKASSCGGLRRSQQAQAKSKAGEASETSTAFNVVVLRGTEPERVRELQLATATHACENVHHLGPSDSAARAREPSEPNREGE